jgi:hypothetical protein
MIKTMSNISLEPKHRQRKHQHQDHQHEHHKLGKKSSTLATTRLEA